MKTRLTIEVEHDGPFPGPVKAIAMYEAGTAHSVYYPHVTEISREPVKGPKTERQKSFEMVAGQLQRERSKGLRNGAEEGVAFTLGVLRAEIDEMEGNR